MSYFEKIPFEVKLVIFSFLNLDQILKLRSLSKKLKSDVESLRIRNLCVTTDRLSYYKFVSLIFKLKSFS